jgi:hypothetical protein
MSSLTPNPNADPLLQAVIAAWSRLPPDVQQAFAAAIIHAAGQTGPARRTRHRVFTPDQITALRARTAACVAECPTAPNRMIASRIGISLSTYKRLHLNQTARSCLAMSTAPLSASRGYGGECAATTEDVENGS